MFVSLPRARWIQHGVVGSSSLVCKQGLKMRARGHRLRTSKTARNSTSETSGADGDTRNRSVRLNRAHRDRVDWLLFGLKKLDLCVGDAGWWDNNVWRWRLQWGRSLFDREVNHILELVNTINPIVLEKDVNDGWSYGLESVLFRFSVSPGVVVVLDADGVDSVWFLLAVVFSGVAMLREWPC
ncbi:hypothetical protein Ancab_034011 [Ancistrocladus abbreviatus]